MSTTINKDRSNMKDAYNTVIGFRPEAVTRDSTSERGDLWVRKPCATNYPGFAYIHGPNDTLVCLNDGRTWADNMLFGAADNASERFERVTWPVVLVPPGVNLPKFRDCIPSVGCQVLEYRPEGIKVEGEKHFIPKAEIIKAALAYLNSDT